MNKRHGSSKQYLIKKIVILLLTLPQFSFASLDPNINFSSAPQSSRGYSMGEPDTADVFNLLNIGALAQFSTNEDAPVDDLSAYSDQQIEDRFRSDMDLTDYWLDRTAADPHGYADLGTVLEASRKSVHAPSMSALTCMAAAIQGEAGGESAAGKAAVGSAIMVRAGGSASRVCSAVFAHGQFESMQKRQRGANADSLRAAQMAINNGGRCTYDHFINMTLQRQMGRAIPCWVRNYQAWQCPSKVIGGHTFFAACDCRQGRPVCSG